jgi:hypothetical protein
MSDPYRDPAHGPYGGRSNMTVWALATVVVLLLIGLGYWGMNRNHGTTSAANPPAVIATPSAVPGRPAPAPQETTGQAAPPAR